MSTSPAPHNEEPNAPVTPTSANQLPDIGRLHRNLRWAVLGIVVAWMLGMGVFNLGWSQRLVESEFQHHMTDQAQALASHLRAHLGRGETLEKALSSLADWPGRTHEIDVLATGGRALGSTSREVPLGSVAEPPGYGVVVPLTAVGDIEALRLWMPTEHLTRQYHHVAFMNLAAIAGAGFLLALLMSFATTRASRAYETLLRQVEDLESRHARLERFEAMGRMAASVAHEIRNPLNAIGLGLQRMRREMPVSSADSAMDWHRVIDQLRAEVQRLDAVVAEFLSLASPPRLELGSFDVRDLVRHVAELYAPEAREAGVLLELELPESPVRVTADQGGLNQLLSNLVRNGVQALSANNAGGVVRVSLTTSAGWYRLGVSNTGATAMQADLEHMFEMFYTTKNRGTGLGLPNARRIAEAHGGELRARVEDGWTVLTALLPVGSPRVGLQLQGGGSSSRT